MTVDVVAPPAETLRSRPRSKGSSACLAPADVDKAKLNQQVEAELFVDTIVAAVILVGVALTQILQIR
jgi:hypothetical protein